MAETYQTLAQLTTLNDQNLSGEVYNNIFQDAPFLSLLPAELASAGDKHSHLRKTTAGSAGFRAVNAGYAHTAAVWSKIEIDLKLIDGSFTLDKALTLGSVSRESVLAMHLADKLKSSYFSVEQQIFQGVTDGSASGFVGLNDSLKVGGDAENMLVDATGSTAGGCYSAYLVRVPEVKAIAGNGGVISVGDVTEQRVVDGSDNPFTALYQSVLGYAGFAIGSASSVARIANCDASNKLTDNLIYEAMSLFKASEKPTHIVVPRIGAKHLRESRTTYNPVGSPAPYVDNIEGVKVVISDGISITSDAIATT